MLLVAATNVATAADYDVRLKLAGARGGHDCHHSDPGLHVFRDFDVAEALAGFPIIAVLAGIFLLLRYTVVTLDALLMVWFCCFWNILPFHYEAISTR